MKKTMNRYKFFSRMQFIGILVLMVTAFMVTSCSDDDNDGPANGNSLVGTWVATTLNYRDDGVKSVKVTLKFNSDYTGSIAEVWEYNVIESSRESYQMKFKWSTKPDENTLIINYVSGDRHTEVLAAGTGLWTRKYAVTGKTLNLFSKTTDSWTFHKK